MTKLTAKKKKKVDGHEVAGKIITFFFAAILIVGIWFLVDLFRDRTVNYKNVAGSWKLTGNPDVYYTFEQTQNPNSRLIHNEPKDYPTLS